MTSWIVAWVAMFTVTFSGVLAVVSLMNLTKTALEKRRARKNTSPPAQS